MDHQALDEKAIEVIREHDIDPSNGYDIVSLAKRMGFYVATAFLEDNEDGFVMVNNKGEDIYNTGSNKLIVVNETREQSLKRFIIAHEIGHYVINGKETPMFAHRKKTNGSRTDNEQDIDYFAASLLMPKDAFIAKNNLLINDGRSFSERIETLVSVFKVPMVSVLRRFEELKLVPLEGNA